MRKYSQVFLINPQVAGKIADACGRDESDFVVEIGPGKGFLTELLAEKYAGRLIAIEIDPEMVQILRRKFTDDKIARIIEADFLESDLSAVLPSTGIVQFAGNLPYAVASPILQKILAWPRFTSAVLMFQKEVADRILSGPGFTGYGVLTLSVLARADVSRVAEADKSDFSPRPKVDSSVLYFKRREKAVFEGEDDEKSFFRAAHAAFSQKRKKVLNSLSASLDMEKGELAGILESCGINPGLRAEDIPLEGYLRLSKAISARVRRT